MKADVIDFCAFKNDYELFMVMVLNETDAGKRGAYMAWSSGVHLKEADMVGDIILT